MRLPSPPLLLITDRQQARGDICDIAEAAFAAGCRWLSLREKDLPEAQQGELLRELLDRAQPFQAKVTLHGNPALAQQARAHGVHLSAGGDAAAARRVLGKDALIGLSVHGVEEARAADDKLVDYVIAGPVFETRSKPGYGPALGPEGLALIARACPAPVVAIGGIDPQNPADCRLAGAAGIAVMGAVMRATNPAEMVAQLIGALTAPLT
ncbi:MAG TPA: thiamine phosphate synthase [Xanthobacteraceae bacterium]|nr:thiamine phosphate synthase [Xanthobacteraceae bacterium]